MKQVPVYQNYFALVDDEDFEKVGHLKWHAFKSKNGNKIYAKRNFRVNGVSKSQLMHRVILGVDDPKILIDHENGDGLDNQKQNIRPSTNAENTRNRGKIKSNQSGFKGVSYNKNLSLFESKIGVDNRTIHLGLYQTAIEAAIAYNNALFHHGSFAMPNEIPVEQQGIEPVRIQRAKTCTYHGVFYVVSVDRWRAAFVFKKRKYYVGQFKTADDAARAYNAKALEVMGDKAILNIL